MHAVMIAAMRNELGLIKQASNDNDLEKIATVEWLVKKAEIAGWSEEQFEEAIKEAGLADWLRGAAGSVRGALQSGATKRLARAGKDLKGGVAPLTHVRAEVPTGFMHQGKAIPAPFSTAATTQKMVPQQMTAQRGLFSGLSGGKGPAFAPNGEIVPPPAQLGRSVRPQGMPLKMTTPGGEVLAPGAHPSMARPTALPAQSAPTAQLATGGMKPLPQFNRQISLGPPAGEAARVIPKQRPAISFGEVAQAA